MVRVGPWSLSRKPPAGSPRPSSEPGAVLSSRRALTHDVLPGGRDCPDPPRSRAEHRSGESPISDPRQHHGGVECQTPWTCSPALHTMDTHTHQTQLRQTTPTTQHTIHKARVAHKHSPLQVPTYLRPFLSTQVASTVTSFQAGSREYCD